MEDLYAQKYRRVRLSKSLGTLNATRIEVRPCNLYKYTGNSQKLFP